MKTKFLFLILISYSSCLVSQIQINPSAFDVAKNGRTYFVVVDKDFKAVLPYTEVIKKYWKLTPIEVISETEIGRYMIEGNSFFKFHKIIVQTNHDDNILNKKSILLPFESSSRPYYQRPGETGSTKEGVFVDMFTFDDKFIEKYKEKERPYMLRDITVISRFAISLPYQEKIFSDKDFFMGDNLASNWQPGYLKNYLENIQNSLTREDSRKMNKQVFSDNLIRLKTDTLYIPSDVEYNMSEKDSDAGKNLFENYSFYYLVIGTKDLSEKILNSKKSFYYLLFIHSTPNKYIEIIDSGSGEIVYSNVSVSKYIKQADFKDLDNAIKIR